MLDFGAWGDCFREPRAFISQVEALAKPGESVVSAQWDLAGGSILATLNCVNTHWQRGDIRGLGTKFLGNQNIVAWQ